MPLNHVADLRPGGSDSPSIELSKDKMSAHLIYHAERVSRTEIDHLLKENNIVFGIREDVINRAVQIRLAGEPLLIARGSEPVNGQDARVEFVSGSQTASGAPSESFGGRVDFYNLNLIRNVAEGEVIAVKLPPETGVSGSTVTGEEIPAKPGKDMKMMAGRNVKLVPGPEVGYPEGSIALVSVARGHFTVLGNQINVFTLYEVQGDIDFSTGNVEFNGSVVVKGSVREGFRITAEGDVFIGNNVSDGVIECSGNVQVTHGIVGTKSRIKAKGSVTARFIENSTIESGEDVIVRDAVMHSRISAGRSVTVNGKGVIVGGSVRAGDEIRCTVAGSQLATSTELEAGIDPELRNEYFRLLKEGYAVEANYDKADQAVNLLRHMQETMGQLALDKQTLLMKLTKVQGTLARDLKELRLAIKDIRNRMIKSDRGRVAVLGTAMPGVKITIGGVTTLIQDSTPFVCFTKNGAEIRMSSCK